MFINCPELARQIIETANKDQHIILSAPPAMGKTRLLMLVMPELESQNNEGTVLFFKPKKGGNGETILSLL
jgi:replicative DNA helicase